MTGSRRAAAIRERVAVGAAGQRDADERLEAPSARGGVDDGDDPGDHPGVAQAAHAVGGGVRAQAHGGPEVAP